MQQELAEIRDKFVELKAVSMAEDKLRLYNKFKEGKITGKPKPELIKPAHRGLKKAIENAKVDQMKRQTQPDSTLLQSQPQRAS